MCVCVREAAVLVTSVGIQKGDYGSVLVGGREIDPENVEQSVDRSVIVGKLLFSLFLSFFSFLFSFFFFSFSLPEVEYIRCFKPTPFFKQFFFFFKLHTISP